MKLLDEWNRQPFSIYTSEERGVLGLLKRLGVWIGKIILKTDEIENIAKDNQNKKVSYDDMLNLYKMVLDKESNKCDYVGSWHGIERPEYAEPGQAGVVANHTDQLKNLHFNIFKQVYGAKGDGVTDNSNALKLAIKSNTTLIIPAGIYRIEKPVEIEGLENVTILCEQGAIFKNKKDVIGITFNNITNLKISGLCYNSDEQHNREFDNRKNRDIVITNCSNVTINDCIFYGGCQGISIERSSNIKFFNNLVYDYAWWGNTFGKADGGHIYNCEIFNNVCYGLDDGIKLTGIIKSVNIYNNVCKNNRRDGIDWAGHGCDNVNIYENDVRDNTLKGIEYKTLVQTTYPISMEYTTEDLIFHNVFIHDNKVNDNLDTGIDVSYNSDLILQTVKNVYVYNNSIVGIKGSGLIGSHSGIRTGGFGVNGKELHFNNNTIIGEKMYYGIRLINISNCEVKKCNIDVGGTPIYIERQGAENKNIYEHNLIEECEMKSHTSGQYCIRANEGVENTKAISNKLYPHEGSYSMALTHGLLINSMNVNMLYNGTVKPTGRGFKGEIALSSDLTVSNCIGWLCTVGGATSTWVEYGKTV